MKTKIFALLLSMAVMCSGCGGAKVYQDEINNLIAERDALQEQLAEAQAAIPDVSQEEYDSIVKERAELKEKVKRQEETIKHYETEERKAGEAASAEEEKQEDISSRFAYDKGPFTVADDMGHRWDIDSFEIYEIEDKPNRDELTIKYKVSGIGDDYFFSFFCYDKDGFQIDKFNVYVTANGHAFKYDGEAFIKRETVRIELE